MIFNNLLNCSHAPRGRVDLNSNHNGKGHRIKRVTPHVGVWIETQPIYRYHYRYQRSRPTWVKMLGVASIS